MWRSLTAPSGHWMPRPDRSIWSVIQPGGANSSPAVADGRLYIAMHNRGLLALNANTGAQLWLAPMPGPQWSSPAVDNGRVFVGSRDDHKLYAFDAVTGATLWTATTNDWVQTSPAVDNGVVYIGNNAGNLYAFNAADRRSCLADWFAPGFGGLSSTDGGERRGLHRLGYRCLGDTIRWEALRAQCCYRPGVV